MEVISEGRESKWDIDSVKEYISQFNTLKDFYESPEYNDIAVWISNRRNRTGDQTLTMQNMLSELKDKDNKQTTEKLKELFPDFNFDNVTYGKDERHHKTIDGVICEKTDSEGVVHGEVGEIRLEQLKQNSCKKCYSEWLNQMYPQDLDSKIEKFMSTVPQDTTLSFEKENFYLVPRSEGSNQTRLFVKNFKCTNHETPVNLYPKGTVAYFDNHLKFACPVCNKERNIKWKGEYTMVDILKVSGYTVDTEKKLGAYSFKGSGNRNKLKSDAYFVKEDGTVVIAEFDGRQHFFPVEGRYRGLEGYKERVLNDLAKNKFCKENGIKLIRISFNDQKNIASELEKALSKNPMDDIYLSTNYPKLGWNNPDLPTIPIQVTESKMKKDYILTELQLQRIVESQHELLSESDFMDRLKRRVNKKSFEKYIIETQEEFPDLCGDYADEYEYSGNIIAMAIDHFFTVNEDYFPEGSYEKFIDIIFPLAQNWYGDDLMEYYLTACGDDMMNEAVDIDIEPNKVIVKLFKILNTQKSNYNNKRDLQIAIKDYLPYFGIDPDFAPYILELYLLNYRQDGDYSSLTKDNFIDPRKMKGKRTPNYNAKVYTKAQLPFKGSNLRGYWRATMDGKIYIVESYGWYPVYIYKDGKWYETSDRYSSSTGKQMNASRPYRWNDTLESQVYLLSRQEMEMIERGVTHEKVMELKRKAFRDMAPSLVSQKVSTAKSPSYGAEPKISIKFKISSVEDIDDKNVVNVDIQDVLKVVDGKQVPTPENYLKGEIPNLTPEKVEKQIEAKLRNNFREYLGPLFSDKPEEENIVFRFNHLKQ